MVTRFVDLVMLDVLRVLMEILAIPVIMGMI